MPRVKRGSERTKKRRNFLKLTKGYRWGRKNKIKLAKPAVRKAGAYAFRDRRNKKRTARRVWQIKLNAAVRVFGTTYSKFIAILKSKEIELDRKVLSQIAEKHPEVFATFMKLILDEKK